MRIGIEVKKVNTAQLNFKDQRFQELIIKFMVNKSGQHGQQYKSVLVNYNRKRDISP